MADALYLVDASGFIFRAFHALPPLSTRQGTPTGAAYGFAQMPNRCPLVAFCLCNMPSQHLAGDAEDLAGRIELEPAGGDVRILRRLTQLGERLFRFLQLAGRGKRPAERVLPHGSRVGQVLSGSRGVENGLPPRESDVHLKMPGIVML